MQGRIMNADRQVGLGLIGCGAFGMFCLKAYSEMEQVRIAAVADVVPPAADEFARTFNVPGFHDPHGLIDCDDVDLVHVATPPSSHYELVMATAKAEKHCLCEKPLAMNTAEADEMLAAAAGKDLIVPVNFVLRYNAVTEAVKAVLDSGVLGKVLSVRLTNCAGDTKSTGTVAASNASSPTNVRSLVHRSRKWSNWARMPGCSIHPDGLCGGRAMCVLGISSTDFGP